MDSKEALESLERIKYWHGRVSQFDDLVAGRTGDTKMALLNLKIENSRNKKHPSEINAIDPIVTSLQETVVLLNAGSKDLIDNGRAELGKCTSDLEEFLNRCDPEKAWEDVAQEYAEDLYEEFQQVMICTGKITMKDVMDILQLGKED